LLTDPQRAIIRATVPALQQHGEAITTYFYSNLFAEHPGLLNIFNKANQRPGGQAANLAASILMYAANIDHLDKLGGMVERIAHKHASMDVQTEHYPIVGHSLLLAIRHVLGEVATDEVIDAWAAAYGQLADIMSGREEQLYVAGVQKEGGWRGFKPFRVEKKVVESSTLVSFYLVPEDGAPLPPFSPGQYLSVKLRTSNDPHEQIRQYSLSCAPNGKYYRISVGRERARDGSVDARDGIISNFLHDNVKEEDVLLVHMPLGDFVLDESSSRPVVLISGGVGITPMLSMFEYLTNLDARPVTFVHGTGNRSQHAFGKQIRETASRRPDVKAVIFYDEVKQDDIQGEHHDEEGFIDASMLEHHLPTLDADFYFCGPLPFLKAIEDALDSLSVPKHRRNSEAFSPAPSFLTEIDEVEETSA
jgi:nitric oxide dioxygenase